MNRLLDHPYRSIDHIRCKCDAHLPLGDELWHRIKVWCPRLKTFGYMQRNNVYPSFFPWFINACKVTCTNCQLTIKNYEERCGLIEVNERIMDALREVHSRELTSSFSICFRVVETEDASDTSGIIPVVVVE